MTLEQPQLVFGPAPADRSVARAMGRGARLRCPNCGEGRMFGRYLKVVHACAHCGEELHHERAHDAPPYVVIFIVAHVIVAALLAVEVAYAPPQWVHFLTWIPLTILMSLILLPPVKGALIGLQWALKMHGFGGEAEDGTLSSPDGGLKPESRA